MSTDEVAWKSVPMERTYDMRVAAIIAFNTAEKAGKDRDDALDAAYLAMLAAAPVSAAVAAQLEIAGSYELDAAGERLRKPRVVGETDAAYRARLRGRSW